jgi:uncharacterized protein
MSLQDNKAIVRAYVETVWNRRQLERADEVVAPDFVATLRCPGSRRGWTAPSESGRCISTRFRTCVSRSRS